MNVVGNVFFYSSNHHFWFNQVFVIWIISEIAITLLTSFKSFIKHTNKKSHDKGSLFLIIFGVWFCICISFFIRSQSNLLLPNFFFWIGIVLMLLGIFLRCLSVWTLRKFFSLSVTIESGQDIVQKGPYKYLRHPAYTGGIITLLGMPVSLRSIVAIFIVAITLAVIYGYRITIEEKALSKCFGEKYLKYCKSTWKIIPWIW
jgi:protein-S-isoprenylcysteine O-methyltransferase Ste14